MPTAKTLYTYWEAGVEFSDDDRQSDWSVPPIVERPLRPPARSVSTAADSTVAFEPGIMNAVSIYARAYHLSAQEERLLACSLHGVADKLAADELGCSRNTVGTYWKRIFAKTGFRPQREVLAHVFRTTVLT